MIVNNCPVHPEITGLKVIDLQFLPPNTTSWRKLKDQKLIRCEFYVRFLIIFGNLTSVIKTISLRKKKDCFQKTINMLRFYLHIFHGKNGFNLRCKIFDIYETPLIIIKFPTKYNIKGYISLPWLIRNQSLEETYQPFQSLII